MIKQNVIIFLHIPKTAGTTINDIFRKNFREDEFFDIYHYDYALEKYQQLSKDDKAQLKVIKGHFPFGIHQILGIFSFRYITFLRNPIDRVISQYYHSLNTPSDVYHQALKKNGVSLENCLGPGLIPDNLQVRYLSGTTQLPFGACTQDHLEQAKKNLLNHCAFGMAEQFDESLLWLKQFWPIQDMIYMKRQVTFGRPKTLDTPPETIAKIKAHHHLDLQLYDFAQKKFQENLQTLGKPFQTELQKFQQQLKENNAVNDLYFKGLKLLKDGPTQTDKKNAQINEAMSLFYSLLAKDSLEEDIKGEILFLAAEHDPNLSSIQRRDFLQQGLETFQELHNKKYNRLNSYRIASVYRRLGDTASAEAIFTREISQPRNTDLVLIGGCYFHLGEIALEKNEIDQAEQYFRNCLSANPYHQKAQQYLKHISKSKDNIGSQKR